MKITNITSTIFITSLLVACGGGGSSTTETNPSQVPPPFSMSISSSIEQMNENETANITLAYSNVQGNVTLSIDTDSSDIPTDTYTVTTNDTDKMVTVNLADLNYDGKVAFVITGTDGTGKTDLETISIEVSNPSVLPKLEMIESYQAGLAGILNADQERRILTSLLDLGVLTDTINQDVAGARIASVDTVLDNDLKVILETTVGIGKWRENYAAGNVYEDGIDSDILAANQQIRDYLTPMSNLVSTTQNELGESIVASLAVDTAYLNDNSIISQYWGNPKMGSINNDGEWQFSEQYSFLTALIFPETQTCNNQE